MFGSFSHALNTFYVKASSTSEQWTKSRAVIGYTNGRDGAAFTAPSGLGAVPHRKIVLFLLIQCIVYWPCLFQVNTVILTSRLISNSYFLLKLPCPAKTGNYQSYQHDWLTGQYWEPFCLLELNFGPAVSVNHFKFHSYALNFISFSAMS